MPRRIFVAACIMAIAATSNTDSFGLVFARAAEGLDLSVASLGGLRTVENAASILVALAVAPLIDRVPRKWVFLTGYGLATVAVLLLVALGNAAGTLLYFALNGAAIMLVFTALTAMPADFVSGRTLNRVLGMILACLAITAILIAPIVGIVADSHGWRAGMLVSATVTGFAFLITLIFIPGYQVQSTSATSGGFLQRYRMIFDRRALTLMLGSNLLRFAHLGALLTFMSTFFIHRYDLSLSQIGLIFSAVGVMLFVSTSLCGLILHWLRTRRVLVWGGVLSTGLLVAVMLGQVPLPLAIAGIVAVTGVAAAQEHAGTIAVLRLAPDARGAAMSWNEFAAGSGALLGIGLGSVGLALGGITGLGVALVLIAVAGTVGSRVALVRSGYQDEGGASEPVSVTA